MSIKSLIKHRQLVQNQTALAVSGLVHQVEHLGSRGVHSLPAVTGLVHQVDQTGTRGGHSLPAIFTRKNQWNRAVSEAEKLVGYPTSLVSVRALMDNDAANIAVHLRKLIGSDHPVLRTAKRLIFHGKNNMQVRGLIVLLLSRAAGPNSHECDPNTGILDKQRKLAEIVEMIHTAQEVHKSVVNVPVNISEEEDEELRGILSQLEYGNKISILSGDYLLANACTGLASLRITKIVEIISIAIAEFTQSEFIGEQDCQGLVVPTSDQLSVDCWETRARLASSSLLSAACKGAMLLAGHEEEKQEKAKLFGHHLALAMAANNEKTLFTEDGGLGVGAPFSLAAAPVLFHLQNDTQLLEYIQEFKTDLSKIDYRKIFDIVSEGEGLDQTRELCESHVHQTLDIMESFGDSDATEKLKKMTNSLLL